MNEELESHIEDVMDNFDFYRVKEVMDYLDWQWVSASGCEDLFDAPPTLPEMRKQVRRLMRKAWQGYQDNEGETYKAGTGGFMAVFNGDGFTVTFELAMWNTE
jgi:hypothetical protein